MKMKKLLSVVLTLAMLASFTLPVYAEDTYTMSVTDSIVKISDDAMFGVNSDWAVGGIDKFVVDAANRNFSPTVNIKAATSRSEIPVIRLGEGASQKVLWKDMVGPYDERDEYTLWNVTGPIEFGLVEKIKYYQELNPETEFIITVNMNDTAENAGDLAEFLTGDASTEWGRKRIEYGIAEPIAVKMYQLGNENDIIAPTMTASEYTQKSAEIIAEMSNADEAAVFGAIGGTSLYERYNTDKEYDDTWLKAIVSGLKNKINYVTFNWYFDMTPTNEIDELIDKVNASIFSAIGENDIKICFSEIAGAVYKVSDSETTNPINLKGVLSTADFYIRSYQNKNVTMANYHALNSSSWQYLWLNDNKESGLTGIGMLHQMLKEYGCGNVLSANLTGYERGVESLLAGVAVSPEENKLNLIFVNRNKEAVTVNFNLNDNYKIYNELVLAGTTPSLKNDISNESDNSIEMHRYKYADGKAASSYTLPEYSVCAIGLEKNVSSETVIYSDSFEDAEAFENYTAVLAEDAESVGIAAAIEGGALKLDGYGGDEATYADNYIYLPGSLSTLESYELSANVSVENYEEGYFGIIFGSESKGDLLAEGNGTVALISSEGVAQQKYSAGEATDVVATTTTNAPTLQKGSEFNIKLSVDGGKVSFLVDGAEVYTNEAADTSYAGNIGFLFSDISVKLDNLSVTAAEDKVLVKKSFVYEENFDNVADGTLPENYEITSGTVRAYVENGALIVNNPQWYEREGVILSDLKNVLVDGLTIEADMTLISHNESAIANNAKPLGGFMHGIEGTSKSVAAMRTYASEIMFRDSAGTAIKPSTTITYAEGDTAFENGGTVNVKLVYTDTKTPSVFINGTQISYDKLACSSLAKGFVGLFTTAASIKFDNLKISGKQVHEFSKEETEERKVSFTYEENFDGMEYGSFPEGWIFVKESPATDTSTKSEVRDGALFLYSKEAYTYSAYVLFDYTKVLRPGLTMECDIARVKAPSYNTDNTYAGLMYGVDYDAETNTIKNASYVAPYTTSDRIAVRDFKTNVPWKSDAKNYLDEKGEALSFNWGDKTDKDYFHLKISLNNDTQSPSIYIDGVEVKHDRAYGDSADRILSGMIGLYAYNARVYIDNIVVSGQQIIDVPAGSDSYEADFVDSETGFMSIGDAESNVVLNLVDFYGNKTDITADAEISTELISEKQYATTVKYDKDADGNYEFEKVLEWTLVGFDEGIAYEENFDTMENGTLPEGWIFINECGDSAYAKAEVKDKALYLHSGKCDTYSTYLLFDYKNVLRKNLTMECDITRLELSGGNLNNSCAGLMYGVDYDDETKTVKNGSYVAPYTAKEEVDAASAIAVRDFKTGSMTGCASKIYKNKEGTKLQFNWATREKPVHLKISLNNETQSPVIYIDGVEVEHYREEGKNGASGMIGLYAFNSTVSIDNIKVYGNERKATENTENKIEVLNYKAADDAIEAVVRMNKADSGAKKAFMAVYNKGTKQLVKVSELKNWTAVVKDYRTSIKVEDIKDFSLDLYDVSIFAWDITTLNPVCENAIVH